MIREQGGLGEQGGQRKDGEKEENNTNNIKLDKLFCFTLTGCLQNTRESFYVPYARRTLLKKK
jgi:hypothetical protein